MPRYGKYSSTESPSKNFTEYETRLLTLIGEMVNESIEGDFKKKLCIGTVTRHLTEDESISNIGASIAYSFNKNTDDWTNVQLSTWVCDVIFTPYYVEMPKNLSKKEKKGFGVKTTEPAKIHVLAKSPFEYDEDKSPLVVIDWQGNFNKGTFELKSTRIEKTKRMNPLAAGLLTVATGGLGAAAFVAPTEVTEYKRIIVFDGEETNWGKMQYMPFLNQTKQTGK